MALDTNVTAGDPDHPGLHNEERTEVNAHTANTSNPHTTTLEQARTAGSVFAGLIDFVDGSVPASPGAGVMRIFAADQNGLSVLESINSDGQVYRFLEDRLVRSRATEAISRGEAVYFAGSQGQNPLVGLAQADDVATMPCVGLATTDVADGDYGTFLAAGRLLNMPASEFEGTTLTEGDLLYLSPTTPGYLTNVRPSWPNIAQSIGTVENVVGADVTVLVGVAPYLGGRESGTTSGTFTVGSASGSQVELFDTVTGARTAITVANGVVTATVV